jgi:N6-L-threonylcarbamoyladenine synthase
MLGLPYPGGPSVAKAAQKGEPNRYKLPKAKMDKYDLSFSGLKTAVLRLAQKEMGESYDFPSTKLPERLSEPQKADIAASFQRIAIETVVEKTRLAYEEFSPKSVVIAGGVAANLELRRQLSEALPLSVEYPDLKLCTDNGAMVATLGCFKRMKDQSAADPYKLEIQPNLSM